MIMNVKPIKDCHVLILYARVEIQPRKYNQHFKKFINYFFKIHDLLLKIHLILQIEAKFI
jgi:hypothetical protein